MGDIILHEDVAILLEHLNGRGIAVDTLMMRHLLQMDKKLNKYKEGYNAEVRIDNLGILNVIGEGIEIHTYVENLFGDEPHYIHINTEHYEGFGESGDKVILGLGE